MIKIIAAALLIAGAGYLFSPDKSRKAPDVSQSHVDEDWG